MPPDTRDGTDSVAPTNPDDLVRAAVDTLPINVALLDAAGTIRWTNAAWRSFGERNGAVRPDSVGADYLAVTERAETTGTDAIAAGIRAVLAGEADEIEVEYPCHSPETERWFEMRAAPFVVDGERYVTVAHVDVTDRVQSTRGLQRFQRAIETAGHAIFFTDSAGTITYVNPAFEAITGYTSTEAVGETPRLLKSGEMDLGFYETLWETVADGDVWEGTIVNRRKSGALYWAHQTIAPVLDGDGEPREFVAMQTELTELREAQRHARKLAHVLRHDLRNQLNVVQGHAGLIEADEGDAEAHAAVISRTASKLVATTEKGQQLSAFLATDTTPQPDDVADVVRAAVDALAAAHPTATVSVTAPGTATALAVGALGIAIRELVENGIVHSDDEPPAVDVVVSVEADWVTVRVSNPGSGVPAMQYEPLEATDPSQLYHDTGFGLNLTYWIVRRSGGHLEFSEPDDDTTVVTVRLPRD